MIAEISFGIQSLQTATNIIKGLNSANTQAAINDVKLSLQTHILDAHAALSAAQASQTAGAKRISDLEQQIVELKDWKGEKQRYHLQAIDSGSFAYVPKPGMENGEDPHWLCANCFNRGQKSFLQFKGQDKRPGGGRGDESTYGCDTCRATFKVRYTTNPASHSAKQQKAVSPGERCPKCGEEELRADRSASHPEFGEMGARIHYMKCKCGWEDEKLVMP